jgi:hypothetical protein
MRRRPNVSRRAAAGAVPTIALVAMALVLFVALAATFGHRRAKVGDPVAPAVRPAAMALSAAAPSVANAAQPTSSLPGAVAQAEEQARQWGPGGGPPVVLPTDSSSIHLIRPVGRPVRKPAASPTPAAAVGEDMIAFLPPVAGTMTPCGNDSAQTSLRYQRRIEVESRGVSMRWECRYLPTGSRAASKVEVDCAKKTLAEWSTVFFKGNEQLTETFANEEMHAPRPGSLDAKLLSLACALPQPSDLEAGRRAPRPDEIAPARDACFTSAARTAPKLPRGMIPAESRKSLAAPVFEKCVGLAFQWVLACAASGTPEAACVDEVTQRAISALQTGHP